MNGYIVKGIGGFYYVKTPDGIVECKPRGIFRKQKLILPVPERDRSAPFIYPHRNLTRGNLNNAFGFPGAP